MKINWHWLKCSAASLGVSFIATLGIQYITSAAINTWFWGVAVVSFLSFIGFGIATVADV